MDPDSPTHSQDSMQGRTTARVYGDMCHDDALVVPMSHLVKTTNSGWKQHWANIVKADKMAAVMEVKRSQL